MQWNRMSKNLTRVSKGRLYWYVFKTGILQCLIWGALSLVHIYIHQVALFKLWLFSVNKVETSFRKKFLSLANFLRGDGEANWQISVEQKCLPPPSWGLKDGQLEEFALDCSIVSIFSFVACRSIVILRTWLGQLWRLVCSSRRRWDKVQHHSLSWNIERLLISKCTVGKSHIMMHGAFFFW